MKKNIEGIKINETPGKNHETNEELASNLKQKKSALKESEIRCKEKTNNYLNYLHDKEEKKRIFSLIRRLPQIVIDRETSMIFREDGAEDKEWNRTLNEHELSRVYVYLTKEMEDKVTAIKNNRQIKKGYTPIITLGDMKESIRHAISVHAYFCKNTSTSIDQGQIYSGSFEQGKRR